MKTAGVPGTFEVGPGQAMHVIRFCVCFAGERWFAPKTQSCGRQFENSNLTPRSCATFRAPGRTSRERRDARLPYCSR